MRVLELGSFISVAYAGMILAEQGHEVVKFERHDDPIRDLRHGDTLYGWLNDRKAVLPRHFKDVLDDGTLEYFDVVIDNILPETLVRHNVDPAALARVNGVRWISLRSELGGRSFDLIAQMRAWGEYDVHIPFYLGDTVAGLWMAFKALAVEAPGHYVIGHASCLQKLVEGELTLNVPRRTHGSLRPDPNTYTMAGDRAHVEYRDHAIDEPKRDRAWKLRNLWHRSGRIVI